MKLLVCLSLAVLGLVPSVARAQRVLYLVRHAEKVDESEDPPLSAAGQARARRLAFVLADAGVGAIYASDLRRTIATAAPLASARKLPIQRVNGHQIAAVIARLRAEHPVERVLLVAHSDTLPQILAAYGASVPPITSAEYNRLYAVVPAKDGPAEVILLRY